MAPEEHKNLETMFFQPRVKSEDWRDLQDRNCPSSPSFTLVLLNVTGVGAHFSRSVFAGLNPRDDGRLWMYSGLSKNQRFGVQISLQLSLSWCP